MVDYLSRKPRGILGKEENITEGLVATICLPDPKLNGSEPQFLDLARFLASAEIKETNQRKTAIRHNVKNFMLWNDTFFRCENDLLRIVPPFGQLPEILATFHDDIGHWDVG